MIFVRRELIRRSVVVFPLFSHTFCFVVYQYERLLFSLLLQSSLDYLRRLACHVMEKTVSTKWYYIIPLIFSKNTKEPKAPNHKSIKITKKVFYFVLFFAESIYRRGARRWRKVYKVNGHIFQAKRFNRVTPFPLLAATLTCSQ